MARSASLARLPLAPDAARTAIERALTAHADFEVGIGIWDAVRGHAAGPDRVALVDGAARISYAELAASALRLAESLAASGVAAGTIVAAVGDRSPDTVRTFLALERLGAVYLPIDPEWPIARVEEVLRRSEARLLLDYLGASGDDAPAEARGAGAASAAARAGVPRRELHTLTGARTGAGPVAEAASRDHSLEPRYCIFTSGTTGRPKGALVEHRGMVNHLRAKIAELGLSPHDSVAFTAPLVFDISIWQMLAPLLAGGTVVVVRQPELEFQRKLAGCLERAAVTVVELVPALVGWLVEVAERRAARILPDLRWLISTGEELPVALAGRALAALPHVRLLNAYGPTECSDDVTHHEVTAEDLREARLPVGSAVPNARLYLLTASEDGLWHAAKPGQDGELFVGGLVVGLGYLNDPENDTKAFYADSIDETSPTGRLYRTGDAARFENGTVRYLGRVDRQVKVAGVRMELDEIEAVLSRQPGVGQCAAFVVAGAEPVLVAYFTEREPVDAARLRQALAAALPAPMVPRRLTPVARIPLTRNGKTDYRALSASEGTNHD